MCDDVFCNSLWGDLNHAFSYRPSAGASGGLLIMWDAVEVEVWSLVSHDHMLQVHGRFIQTNVEFYLFNICAPCEPRAKQELWASLSVHLSLLRGEKVCVYGEFNSVRCPEERRALRGGSNVLGNQHFNQFIVDNELCDLPLCGRRYTWFKGDGSSMSRID